MQKKNLAPPHKVCATRFAAALLVLFAGCGDAHTFTLDPGSVDPHAVGSDHACFEGSEVTLVRYASACDGTSKSLESVVYDGLVFPAEDVAELGSPCTAGPNPAIDVMFEMARHSVVLDFSQVRQSGRFPQAVFDGYVLEVILEESNGTLMSVQIDRARTTLGVDANDVVWDRSHIDLNFEGVQYDKRSVLALDLTFARVEPPGL